MAPQIPLTLLTVTLAVAAFAATAAPAEAPSGFDNASNGLVDPATHQADLAKFNTVEQIADGLGPLYNAQSCRECHQNPVSGAASQVSELRVGHTGSDGRFQNPAIPIAHGTVVITGRSLVNDRAICPSGTFPNTEIQERVPDSENVRTARMSVGLLGDGFVEAVPDQALIAIGREQCSSSHGRICGEWLVVPIVEAPGQVGVGRFGWKDQQASLLSFAANAYMNEIGVTNRLFPQEATTLCNTAPEPNDTPGSDGLSDIDRFARFVRATKAPARDQELLPRVNRGSALFDTVGCASCHVRTLQTAPAGTRINGGTFVVSPALGSVTFHPYSDFLLHNVGTGDGIVQGGAEDYGPGLSKWIAGPLSQQQFELARNKIRTAPLWGVRLQPRLMHDGASLTLREAILRHQGEAADETRRFQSLSPQDQEALLQFLRSL